MFNSIQFSDNRGCWYRNNKHFSACAEQILLFENLEAIFNLFYQMFWTLFYVKDIMHIIYFWLFKWLRHKKKLASLKFDEFLTKFSRQWTQKLNIKFWNVSLIDSGLKYIAHSFLSVILPYLGNKYPLQGIYILVK